MRVSSRKQKGRRASQEVKDLMMKHAPELLPDDILVTSSGVTGEDLVLSPKARSIYPFVIECKNQEALNIWSALEQAKSHPKKEGSIPTLAFKRNRTELFIAFPLEEFLQLWVKKNENKSN